MKRIHEIGVYKSGDLRLEVVDINDLEEHKVPGWRSLMQELRLMSAGPPHNVNLRGRSLVVCGKMMRGLL